MEDGLLQSKGKKTEGSGKQRVSAGCPRDKAEPRCGGPDAAGRAGSPGRDSVLR